jgi:predicted HicB family RNase H-like nuclease
VYALYSRSAQRLPTALQEQLVAEAERQGVSLNTLIVSLLAGAIGFSLDAHL